MTHVVVGVFEDMTPVDRVKQDLRSAGFQDSAVTVKSQQGTRTGARDVRDEDEGAIARFFRSLFRTDSDDEHTGLYSEAVRRKHAVITVTAIDTAQAERAEDVLERCGAIDVHERSEQWRQEGWKAPGTGASQGRSDLQQREGSGRSVRIFSWVSEGMDQPVGATTDHDAAFREHWTSNYGDAGGHYDEYAPAYRYGSTLAGNERYSGRSWEEIEPQARQDWEKRYPGNAWERFKESVRYGWEKLTGATDSSSARASKGNGRSQPRGTT
jgi:hypothetical protein